MTNNKKEIIKELDSKSNDFVYKARIEELRSYPHQKLKFAIGVENIEFTFDKNTGELKNSRVILWQINF